MCISAVGVACVRRLSTSTAPKSNAGYERPKPCIGLDGIITVAVAIVAVDEFARQSLTMGLRDVAGLFR